MNSESFTAWQMPVFDTPESAPAPAPEPAVDADPAPPPAMAPEEAAAADTDDETPAPFRFPTADDIEKLQQEAHREGYAAGYEEGTARVRMEAMRLHSVVEQLEEALAALDNSIAREVLNLGVEIARNVVRQTIRVNPEVVVAVVREAINQLPHQHTAIYLNPEDASVVRSHIGDQLTHAGHRIFEDGAIARGGCKVESGGSQIDATVPTRWDRIVESLVDGAEWLEHD
ncbi:MAG: flagellar assembly protein FliH [Methyloversatilis discipulorum]|jgi:flagellar assembly protein FliH|uniref:flagellar assembly protein FliH n=1 Tax=Methyloversatilis TaxID=378210 RepID=UPI000DB075E9|nr:flagellar assembly protein FliH [Methyloversatilis discipulorum]MBT9516495.1 flagellar assembly protein FliH [Methyloversatilis discipulorum]MBV5286999.1 flagellar assembly protein FliH [Methyloversatilis discipulorum]PZU53333.1 MAG: flagellar assembly protein FliH [Thauera sp.]